MGFDHDKPEEWRVGFSTGAAAERRLPAGKALRPERPLPVRAPCRLEAGAPTTFHSAWPLAERYEALIRVFNDPAPYARRLAARLHARPLAARAVLAHPQSAAALVGHVAFDNLCVAVEIKRCETWPERPRLLDTS